MKAALLAGIAVLSFVTPAFAQSSDPHAGHDMSAMGTQERPADPHAGHDMSVTPETTQGEPADPHAGHDMSGSEAQEQPVDPHAGHDMSGMEKQEQAADPHAGHDMSAMQEMGETKPAGDAPPPPLPTDFAADGIFPPSEMAGARAQLRKEHGGAKTSMILFDLAEYQLRSGRDGYRWEAEGWFGGDINRLVVKTEGEGDLGGAIENAEVQLLYSRAIGPYFDLQAGVRHDIEPNPSRTYATIGFEGLAPYWFELEGALFLSDKGDFLGRVEGSYDQRITQRLILQPRAEFNLAAQDVPENGIGAGLSSVELGLRLRYEIAREFAPYVGISWDRKTGDTARFARAEGEDVEATSLVFGVRAWF